MALFLLPMNSKIKMAIKHPLPFKKLYPELNLFSKKKNAIRHSLALLVKNQVRRIPELFFYNDDSLEHIDSIDNALKKTEDPIKNSSLLPKRKKI